MPRLFASSADIQPQSKVRLRSNGRPRRDYPRERRLQFESLEDRRVLAIDLVSRGLPDPLILRVDSDLGSTSTISANGRYVVFSTNDRFELDSNGLPLPPPPPGEHGEIDLYSDLYLKDLQTGTYQHLNSAPLQNALFAAISPSGKYVAWMSEPNIYRVPGFADYCVFRHGAVVVRNLGTGAISRFETDSQLPIGLSVSDNGTVLFAEDDGFFGVSSDFKWPFRPAECNDNWLTPGGTALPNIKTWNPPADPRAIAEGFEGEISGDGKFAVHVGPNIPLVVRENLASGVSEAIATTVSPDGMVGQRAAISGDGRFVAFVETKSSLEGGNDLPQVYVKEFEYTEDVPPVEIGEIKLVSTDLNNVLADGDKISVGSISDDGRFVNFVSNAKNFSSQLMPGNNVYVKDLKTGQLALAHPSLRQGFGAGSPSISGNGKYVAFSGNGDFSAADDNPGDDVYRALNPLYDNLAPRVIIPIPRIYAIEKQDFQYIVPAGTIQDDDAAPFELEYSAALAGGADLPSWLTFEPTERIFRGSPTDAEVGTYSITVTAQDRYFESASTTFELVVDNVPEVNSPLEDDVSFTAQTALSHDIPADTFIDPDADDFLSYSATLADGAPLPTWLRFNPFLRRFTGYPSNEVAGSIDVRVRATDVAGAFAEDDFALEITSTDRPTPRTVFVNSDWTTLEPGADPDGPASDYHYDGFADLQFGLDAVAEGGTVVIYAGLYQAPPGTSDPTAPNLSNFGKPLTIDLEPSGLSRTVTVVSARLELDPQATLKMAIDSPATFEQLSVINGTITLDMPALELVGSYDPTLGTSFQPMQALAFQSPLGVPRISGQFSKTRIPYSDGAMAVNVVAVDPGFPLRGYVGLTFSPIANDDHFTVAHDVTLSIAAAELLANDGGLDGTPVSVELASLPLHGLVTTTSSVITYMPAIGFAGLDTLSYRIVGAGFDSNVATVNISVVEGLSPTFWTTGAVKFHGKLVLDPVLKKVWQDADVAPTASLASVNFQGFKVPRTADQTTFLDALNAVAKGNPDPFEQAQFALMPQAAAAYLNAAHPGIYYPLTTKEVVSQVNAALAAGTAAAVDSVRTMLTEFNNLGGFPDPAIQQTLEVNAVDLLFLLMSDNSSTPTVGQRKKR